LPWIVVAAVVVLLAGITLVLINRRFTAPPAATSPASAQPNSQPAPVVGDVLDNDVVLAMVQSKVPTKIIVERVQSGQNRFNLSNQELIRLSKSGVPQEILDAMMHPKPQAPAKTAAVNPGSVKPAAGTTTPPAPSPTSAAPISTASPAASVPPPAAPTPEKVPPLPVTTPVSIQDALPLGLTLAENIPGDAEPGRTIRFETTNAIVLENAIVIRAGAEATGQIVDGGRKKKLTFKMTDVVAVDGTKLPIRTGAREGKVQIDSLPGKHTKEIAWARGESYTAYILGQQKVNVRK